MHTVLPPSHHQQLQDIQREHILGELRKMRQGSTLPAFAFILFVLSDSVPFILSFRSLLFCSFRLLLCCILNTDTFHFVDFVLVLSGDRISKYQNRYTRIRTFMVVLHFRVHPYRLNPPTRKMRPLVPSLSIRAMPSTASVEVNLNFAEEVPRYLTLPCYC